MDKGQQVLTETLQGFSIQNRPLQGEIQAMLPALKPTLVTKKKLKPLPRICVSQSRIRRLFQPEQNLENSRWNGSDYFVSGQKLSSQSQVDMATVGVIPLSLTQKQEKSKKIVVPKPVEEPSPINCAANADLGSMLATQTELMKPPKLPQSLTRSSFNTPKETLSSLIKPCVHNFDLDQLGDTENLPTKNQASFRLSGHNAFNSQQPNETFYKSSTQKVATAPGKSQAESFTMQCNLTTMRGPYNSAETVEYDRKPEKRPTDMFAKRSIFESVAISRGEPEVGLHLKSRENQDETLNNSLSAWQVHPGRKRVSSFEQVQNSTQQVKFHGLKQMNLDINVVVVDKQKRFSSKKNLDAYSLDQQSSVNVQSHRMPIVARYCQDSSSFAKTGHGYHPSKNTSLSQLKRDRILRKRQPLSMINFEEVSNTSETVDGTEILNQLETTSRQLIELSQDEKTEDAGEFELRQESNQQISRKQDDRAGQPVDKAKIFSRRHSCEGPSADGHAAFNFDKRRKSQTKAFQNRIKMRQEHISSKREQYQKSDLYQVKANELSQDSLWATESQTKAFLNPKMRQQQYQKSDLYRIKANELPSQDFLRATSKSTAPNNFTANSKLEETNQFLSYKKIPLIQKKNETFFGHSRISSMNEDLEKIAKSIERPQFDDQESMVNQNTINRQFLAPHQHESSHESQHVSTHKVGDTKEKQSSSSYKMRINESKNQTKLGKMSKAITFRRAVAEYSATQLSPALYQNEEAFIEDYGQSEVLLSNNNQNMTGRTLTPKQPSQQLRQAQPMKTVFVMKDPKEKTFSSMIVSRDSGDQMDAQNSTDDLNIYDLDKMYATGKPTALWQEIERKTNLINNVGRRERQNRSIDALNPSGPKRRVKQQRERLQQIQKMAKESQESIRVPFLIPKLEQSRDQSVQKEQKVSLTKIVEKPESRLHTVTPQSEALSSKLMPTYIIPERHESDHTLKDADIEQPVTVYSNVYIGKKEMQSSSSQTPLDQTEKND